MKPRKLLVSGIVGAAMMTLAPVALSQETGFYIGGSFGQSSVDVCGDLPGATSCDDTDTAWKVLGGYQINRNFAAELGYTNLGEITASAPGASITAKSTAWELVGIGAYPLTNQFSLYGKLGVYRAEVKVTSTLGLSGDDSDSDVTYGVGVRYDLTRAIGVRAEFQKYGSDFDVLSVGVLFKF